jgi:uncharacterized protein
MKKTKIIITGTGYRSLDELSENENIFQSNRIKVNIGAATAKYLAEKGFDIMLLSRTEDKLKKIRKDLMELFPQVEVSYYPLDILNEREVAFFFKNLSNEYIYSYVHSAGLSTANYSLKDDNPYLPIEELPIELPTLEFTTVVQSLLLMIRGFLPFFQNQNSSKVIVINSMSGIRSYPLGYSHSSAKGGLHNAVRALSLELSKRNIFFSEVMPGIVDTGLYDTEAVIRAVKKIGLEFGYDYGNEGIPKMSPYSVAEVVHTCLTNTANILSVNMVSQGQWTHQSA